MRRVSTLAPHALAAVVSLSALTGVHLVAQTTVLRPRTLGGAPDPVAQVPPRDQTQARTRTGAGVIRGRVTRADNGLPIARVTIAIVAEGVNGTTALTDENGRYEFTRLPPGRYQLGATKTGFAQTQYGSRGGGFTWIDVGDRETVDRIDLRLAPGAAIEGTVFDRFGEPLANATINLMRRRFVGGERRIVSAGIANALTDDLGHFRLHSIPAGVYFVAAGTSPGAVYPGASTISTGYLGRAPTFFPGTLSESEAQAIVLAAGQQLTGITLQVQRAQLSTITGSVTLARAGFVDDAAVWLVRSGGADQYPGTVNEDGSFSFDSLLPGQYAIMARDGDLGALTHVTVSGEDVAITLAPGRLSTARGRIVFDSTLASRIRPADIHVSMIPVDAGPPPEQYEAQQRIDAAWTFEQTGLIGSYLIRVRAPSEWVLEAVRRHTTDVTDTPIDFTGADDEDITIVLTDRQSTVSGRVLAPAGLSSIGARVVVFAEDARLWGPRSRYVQITSVARGELYTVRGLPPARYIAVVADDLDPDDAQDPEVLETLRQQGVTFTLRDGEAKTVDLRLSD